MSATERSNWIVCDIIKYIDGFRNLKLTKMIKIESNTKNFASQKHQSFIGFFHLRWRAQVCKIDKVLFFISNV